jgi:hypothetical protein
MTGKQEIGRVPTRCGPNRRIVLRNGACQNGKIQNVQPDKLTLESGNTVERSDVRFVGEGVSPIYVN